MDPEGLYEERQLKRVVEKVSVEFVVVVITIIIILFFLPTCFHPK